MQRILLLSIALGACGDDGGDAIDSGVGSDGTVDTAAPGTVEGQVFIVEAAPVNMAIAMFKTGPLYPVFGTAGLCEATATTLASSLDAGTISITGTTSPITLVQDDPGEVYLPQSDTSPDLFTPGATLTVAATGGEVPAFTGTVTAPQPLSITTPTTYSRSAPPTFVWSGGNGELWIQLQSATTAPGILCRVPDTGSYTLTTDALALLPAGVTQVTTFVYRVIETRVEAGAWTVALRAGHGTTKPAADLTP